MKWSENWNLQSREYIFSDDSRKASLLWLYKANNLDNKEKYNIIYMKNPWNSAVTLAAYMCLQQTISVNVRSQYPKRLNLRYHLNLPIKIFLRSPKGSSSNILIRGVPHFEFWKQKKSWDLDPTGKNPLPSFF